MVSPRRIVIACDSFKGTLSSAEANAAVARAAADVLSGCEIRAIEVADGGEGTLAAVHAARAGELRRADAVGPLGEPCDARWLLLPDGSALIESAQAAGLSLVPLHARDPRLTSSFGVGRLIRDALDAGVRRISVALGGTSTNDGGAGLLRALGARLLDEEGRELAGRGQDLGCIRRLDLSGLDHRLAEAELRLLCDVDNPLLGKRGATRVFAPQKGADAAAVEELEAGMGRWAALLDEAAGAPVSELPGAGAAGGMAAALMAVCGARRVSGSAELLSLCGLPEALRAADLCVTGEGRLDSQTAAGKLVSGVLAACREAGVPCAAVAGSVETGLDPQGLGLVACEACVAEGEKLSEAELASQADERLVAAAGRLFISLGL